jgi:hypothetical protein
MARSVGWSRGDVLVGEGEGAVLGYSIDKNAVAPAAVKRARVSSSRETKRASGHQQNSHVGNVEQLAVGAEVSGMSTMPQSTKVHHSSIILLTLLIHEIELLQLLACLESSRRGINRKHLARRSSSRVDGDGRVAAIA